MNPNIDLQGQLTVAFHFDAKAHSGLGHFNRCLNLANVFQTRGMTVFFYLCAETGEHLVKRRLLDGLSISVVTDDKPSTASIIEFCKSKKIDVLLIDDYQFSVESEIGLREHVFLVAIDDHLFDHHAHIVLNHRPGLIVKKLSHKDRTHTLLLGGSKYCLADAKRGRESSQPTADTSKILLHAGGSDLYAPFLSFFYACLQSCRSSSICVDVLCATEKAALPLELKEFLNKNKDWCNTISFDVPLREKLGNYDAVVGPAGTTTYETLIAGSIPLSFEIADDGRDSKTAWAQVGHLFHLSFHEAQDPLISNKVISLFLNNFDKATELVEQAVGRLDGLGCERGVDDIVKCYRAHSLHTDYDVSDFVDVSSSDLNRGFLGPCSSSDALDFLESRNSEQSRRSSTDPSHQIHWVDHLAWWLDSRIKRYKVFNELTGSIEGYFWIKQVSLCDAEYFTSGWFPSIGFNSASGLTLGLKIMKAITHEVNRVDSSGLWVITMRPENHFAIQSNRRFNFRPCKLDKELIEQLYPGSQKAGLIAMSKLIPAKSKSA